DTAGATLREDELRLPATRPGARRVHRDRGQPARSGRAVASDHGAHPPRARRVHAHAGVRRGDLDVPPSGPGRCALSAGARVGGGGRGFGWVVPGRRPCPTAGRVRGGVAAAVGGRGGSPLAALGGGGQLAAAIVFVVNMWSGVGMPGGPTPPSP